MDLYTEKIEFRVSKEQLTMIRKLLIVHKDKFDSLSHFCRCSIVKEIRLQYNNYIERELNIAKENRKGDKDVSNIEKLKTKTDKDIPKSILHTNIERVKYS